MRVKILVCFDSFRHCDTSKNLSRVTCLDCHNCHAESGGLCRNSSGLCKPLSEPQTLCILAANSRGKLTGCILQTWRLVKHAHKNWVMAEGHSICSVKNLVNGHRNNERHSMPIFSMSLWRILNPLSALLCIASFTSEWQANPPWNQETRLETCSTVLRSHFKIIYLPISPMYKGSWMGFYRASRKRPTRWPKCWALSMPNTVVTTEARGSTFAFGSASVSTIPREGLQRSSSNPGWWILWMAKDDDCFNSHPPHFQNGHLYSI